MLIQAEMCIPAPMMTELDREKRLQKARINAWANGCMITAERRVRNPVFDKKDEKTTTMIKIRPVQTQDELDFIMAKLKDAQ